jgi:hypothetical protein
MEVESSINSALCVVPTEGEPQWESFQSILTRILAGNVSKIIIDPKLMTTYELLCSKYGIKLILSRLKPTKGYQQGNKVIFYSKAATTHYKAITVDNKVRNPYDYFQASGTQGFCQMFAFFLAINSLDGFQVVVQTPIVDLINFNKIALNNHVCCIRTIQLIQSSPDILDRFTREFNEIMIDKDSRNYYGIKPGTTSDIFLRDFLIINSDIRNVKYYVYNSPLNGDPARTFTIEKALASGGKRRKTKRRKLI